MRRQLERYGRWLIAIGFLAVMAGVSGSYILVKQHLQNPFAHRLKINAEISTSNGLNPGLAQPVNVAGVRVGTITAAKLRRGRSIVKMEIQPDKLKHVYADAHAALVPNTALKDMQIELSPGTPSAGELHDGDTIPVARTAPPIDSDELTAALDADTREFFETLVGGLDQGTRGRGTDARSLLKALQPTADQVHRLGRVLTARRHSIERLVTNLSALTRTTASKDRELAGLVHGARQTVGALADQEQALGTSIERLPGTLQAARTSLDHATTFANELAPAAAALRPTARQLPATLRTAGPLVSAATPIVRNQLRPFVRSFQPLARNLGPTTKDLTLVTPSLTDSFDVLRYVTNELGYNPPGSDEGYLFWLAWLAHNGASVFSTEDAQGSYFRGLLMFTCENLVDQSGLAPILLLLTGPLGC